MRAIAALIGLVLVATACGGSVDAEVITNASDRVKEAGSARISMRAETIVGGEPTMTMEADSVVDFAAGTGRTTMSMSSPQFAQAGSGMQPCTMISQEQTIYAEIPEARRAEFDGRQWMRADFSEQLGVNSSAYSSDPSEMLEYMRGASSEIEEVGAGEVRGVATTHYRFTVSIEELVEQLTDEQREQNRDNFEQLGLESFPMDVWIADDDLPRRMRFVFNIQEPAEAEHRTTLEIYDYGDPVDIDVPTAEQAYEGEALTAMMVCHGAPTSLGSGAGMPPGAP